MPRVFVLAALVLAACAAPPPPEAPAPNLPPDDHYVVVTVQNGMQEWVRLYAANGMAQTYMGTVPPGSTDKLVLSPQVVGSATFVAKTEDGRYVDTRRVQITRRDVTRHELMAAGTAQK